jgi:hypothetical protein
MGCNVMLNGRKEEYFVWMESEYGREVIDELRRQRNESRSFSAEELLKMMDEFKLRINNSIGRLGL